MSAATAGVYGVCFRPANCSFSASVSIERSSATRYGISLPNQPVVCVPVTKLLFKILDSNDVGLCVILLA